MALFAAASVLVAAGPAEAARRAPARFERWQSVEPRRWPVQRPAIPLPPVRDPAPDAAVAPETPPAPAAESCVARLAREGITVSAATQPTPSQAACIIVDPVRLGAVRPAGGQSVRIEGEPLLACEEARAVGLFLRDLVAPLARGTTGRALVSVSAGGGAECRPRNRVPGAKISAHGRGMALDIASFTLEGGQVIPVGKPGEGAGLLRALRTAACGWFTTVLGPGADPYHGEHLHLDIEKHGSSERYRICE